MTNDWWDGDEARAPAADPINLSNLSRGLGGLCWFCLAGITLGYLLITGLALKAGEYADARTTATIFVAFALLWSQFRFVTPVSLTRECLALELGLRQVELHVDDVAWARQGPARRRTRERWLDVGLKRRRFLGAKWLCMPSDADGRLIGFVRKAGS